MLCVILENCGETIEATNGEITSPSFPSKYPDNAHCVWNIIAPAQFKISLNFTHFDLEEELNIIHKVYFFQLHQV